MNLAETTQHRSALPEHIERGDCIESLGFWGVVISKRPGWLGSTVFAVAIPLSTDEPNGRLYVREVRLQNRRIYDTRRHP